jgi:hypothetical protein
MAGGCTINNGKTEVGVGTIVDFANGTKGKCLGDNKWKYYSKEEAKDLFGPWKPPRKKGKQLKDIIGDFVEKNT